MSQMCVFVSDSFGDRSAVVAAFGVMRALRFWHFFIGSILEKMQCNGQKMQFILLAIGFKNVSANRIFYYHY